MIGGGCLLVVFWTLTCLSVYYISNQNQFYVAAFAVGIVMGGVQSLSRSTYAKLLPENIPDTASYFSFYDATEKLSIVVGLAVFALVEDYTHEMRDSALALDCFFVVGLILLIALFAAEKKAKSEPSTLHAEVV